MTIAFIDLAAQQRRIRPALEAAIARVLDHGAYVFGPEVMEFERQLAALAGEGRTLSCANGTDAIGSTRPSAPSSEPTMSSPATGSPRRSHRPAISRFPMAWSSTVPSR